MNAQLKYTLSLVAVLIIGIILGGLISGRIVQRRIGHLQQYYTEQGFRHEFMQVLRPSPEQMKKIRPILKNYALKNRQNMMMYRSGQSQLMINLQNDLKPFLYPDQVRRLENLRIRREKRFMRHREFRRRMDRNRHGRCPEPR